MKKTERIHLIMRYINNRAQFTIREIQQEFNISRATAIRDIREIEEMGFPLVTEVGRGGGYFVLHNDYLPAVRFTPDELRAILISFMASKNSQLPYLQNRRTIYEKLIGIASQTQQDALLALNDLLLFENTNPANPELLELDDAAPKELNQLINLAVQSRHVTLTYERSSGWPERLDIWIVHIFNSNSRWLMEVYDFAREAFSFLPIEQLRDSEPSQVPSALTDSEMMEKRRLSRHSNNVSIRLGAPAILRFKRLHPPGIILNFTESFQRFGTFSASVDVNDTNQLHYFADWLLYLGDRTEFLKIPKELTECLRTRLSGTIEKLKSEAAEDS